MENLSHSRHPNRPVPSLSKKACNAGSGLGSGPSKAAATTKYNEFSGGPPRFGAPEQSSCLEDYCEIFGGVIASRAAVSSIPMLDLPLVDDRDVYFDVRSPGFDYREVFGGFDDFDFAPSYEELLMDRSEVGEDDSSDEAWTPAEMESLWEETEHAGKSHCFTNGRDSYESIDGSTTEFNISYNVTGQISCSNMFSGVTHVAGLGSVPGYTFAVDEMEYAGETTKLKKKTQSVLVRGDTTSGYAFGNGGRNQKHDSRAVSFPSEPFVTVSDIDLKTKPSEIPPPSRPPPLLKRDSSSSASNCRTTVSGGSADCNSPPFFDAEADTSSAAVREVMEKAKATVKSAVEVLEGKKDGARITVKPSPANERMTEEGKLSVGNTNLPVDWPEVEKNDNVSRKSSEDKHGWKSLPMQGSARFDGNDEWKEATQFFELVRTEEPRNADDSCSGNDIFLHRNAEFPEQKQTRATKSDVEKLKERRAVGDMGKHEIEKLLKNYGTTEVAFDRESHEKMRLAEKVLQEGMEEKLRNVVMHAEAESMLPDHGGSEKHENLLKTDRDGNRLLVDKHAEQKKELHYEEINNNIEKEQEYVFEWEHSARKLREALGLADNESIVEMSLEPNEDGKKSRISDGMDVNEKKLKEALEEQIEDENLMKEARENEENERRVSEALEKAENEKILKASLEQEKERTLKEEQQSKDAFEKEENNHRMREAHEKAEPETKLKLVCEEEEHKGKVREAHEKAELERRQKEALEQEQTERHLEEVQEREENERRAKEGLEKAESEKRLKQKQEENDKKLEEAMELEEKERNLREVSEGAENDERLKEAHELEEMARRQMDAKEREESEKEEKQDDCRGQEDKARLEEATEKATGKEFLRESRGEPKRKDEGGDSHETLYEVSAEEDEAGQKEIRERPDETCSWKDFENKLKDASKQEGLEENIGEKTSQNAAAEEERVKNVAVDGVGCDQREMEESRFTSNLGNNESKLDHQQEEQGSSYHTLAGLNQDVNPEKPLPSRVIGEFVDTTRKEAVQNNASQTTGNKSQNLDEVFAQQRKKEAERIKRERELQIEQLIKTEEEREREREKDGMAFDHRALTDARERLEKACVEAREKSLPPVDAASRYQNSSACAGTDGESPRRYVSRLERHRRTAARVAKALEEKNMRDLVAQREQAERNRLAETLDADVKRWSSGKEGNIRALLSTLQYVLGHESGWQPIPLTEVITSAAVKKAYRKATLCVHPDKLQQRGANVQQKYISEKVFDLLKEAWNRFSSGEP